MRVRAPACCTRGDVSVSWLDCASCRVLMLANMISNRVSPCRPCFCLLLPSLPLLFSPQTYKQTGQDQACRGAHCVCTGTRWCDHHHPVKCVLSESTGTEDERGCGCCVHASTADDLSWLCVRLRLPECVWLAAWQLWSADEEEKPGSAGCRHVAQSLLLHTGSTTGC